MIPRSAVLTGSRFSSAFWSKTITTISFHMAICQLSIHIPLLLHSCRAWEIIGSVYQEGCMGLWWTLVDVTSAIHYPSGLPSRHPDTQVPMGESLSHSLIYQVCVKLP